jgi:hypothetical protein
MPRDKNGGAEAERLTREINADLSASAGPPPRPPPRSWLQPGLTGGFDALLRRPLILGPLASEETKAAWAAGDEAWAAYVNSRPPPTVTIPDPEQEERNERFVEAVEGLGLDKALRAVKRDAPGAKAGNKEARYRELCAEAMKASGGNLTKARRKFWRLSGLSRNRAYSWFAAIQKPQN